MRADVFLDTNILLYAIESGGPAPAKTAAARAVVRRRTRLKVFALALGDRTMDRLNLAEVSAKRG